jgi:hypothetical protein
MNKPCNNKAWFWILPVFLRGLLGHPAADDGGQLFGAGHHRPRTPSSWAPDGSAVMRDASCTACCAS